MTEIHPCASDGTLNRNLNSLPAGYMLCYLLITFVNSLDPDQAQQNIRSDLDPDCLTPRIKNLCCDCHVNG